MYSSHLRKIRRQNADEPRLLPLDGSGGCDLNHENSVAQVCDLSYEDALLDNEVRRHVQSEMTGALPSPDSFHRVLQAIEAHIEQPSVPQLSGMTLPAFSPSFGARLSRSLYTLARGVSMPRVLSGGLAVMLMLLVLGSNASMLLRSNGQDLFSDSYVPEMSEIRREVIQESILARKAAVETAGIQNANDAWHNDPPETWAPPVKGIAIQVNSPGVTNESPTQIEMRKE